MLARTPADESVRQQLAQLRHQLECSEEMVATLKRELGVSQEHDLALARLGLSPSSSRLAHMLLKRPLVTREQLRIALYHDRHDLGVENANRGLDVQMHILRDKLRPLGVEIECHIRRGWALSAKSRARLLRLIAKAARQ